MRGGFVSTPLDDLTYKINGAAMAVHRVLGPGHKEVIYQRAMEAELERCGLSFEPQKNLAVYTEGRLIGYYIPDLIVEGRVVVELKALGFLDKTHLAQVICYLDYLGCSVGLLLDFGARQLKPKRIFPSPPGSAFAVNQQWLFVPDWLEAQEHDRADRALF
jgi:GxxExxY protein